MTFKQTIALVISGVALIGGIANAQSVPGNIQHIEATYDGGILSVRWAPVPETAFYRIYYSHESILENEGNYDDFERTAGPEAAFTFQKLPLNSERIFIGVLAVSKEDLESEGFEQEASVTIARSSSSLSPVPSISSSLPALPKAPPALPPSLELAPSTSIPLKIASVRAVSSTGVLVTFTKNLNTAASFVPNYFLITTLSGTMLTIVRAQVSGNQILVDTESQKPNEEYLFSLLSVIPAEDGTNVTPSEPQVQFSAFNEGSGMASSNSFPSVQSSVSSSVPYIKKPGTGTPPSQTVPTNPSFLSLSAIPRKDGTYNVTARWGADRGTETYGLYTSGDGKQYEWNSQRSAAETSANYSRIAPGTFGVRVTSRNVMGESSGIEKVIVLPASGLGFFGIAAIAGAAAGRRIRRKKEDMVG